MKRAMFLTGIFLILAAGGAVAQDEKKPASGAAAQAAGQGQTEVRAGEGAAAVASGTEIHATLTRSIDAGKARPGDEVTARAAKDIKSGGKVVVPRGSRLIGHVTRAEPREGDSVSELGIVFDRAILKDGSEVALAGSVAAIAAARPAGSAAGNPAGGAGGPGASPSGSGGGLAGTVAGTVGGAANAAAGATGSVGSTLGGAAGAVYASANAVGGVDAAGLLKPGSRGVFGVRDLDLASSASAGAEASIITSGRRNVHLESGTQLLLVTRAGGTKQPAPATQEPDDDR